MGCCQDDTDEDCQSNKTAISLRSAPAPAEYLYVYWGSSPLTVLTDADITALQNNQQKIAFAGTYVCDANDYKYICYPDSFGTATSFINTLNGLNVPMDTVYVVDVNGVNYNVHRSFYPIVSGVSILIS